MGDINDYEPDNAYYGDDYEFGDEGMYLGEEFNETVVNFDELLQGTSSTSMNQGYIPLPEQEHVLRDLFGRTEQELMPILKDLGINVTDYIDCQQCLKKKAEEFAATGTGLSRLQLEEEYPLFYPSSVPDSTKQKRIYETTEQKRLTQKIRVCCDEQKMRLFGHTAILPKAGQLSCGIRKWRTNRDALGLVSRTVEARILGPIKLKISEKEKIADARENAEPISTIETILPSEPEVSKVRPPGWDLDVPGGTTADIIRRSDIFALSREFASTDAIGHKLNVTQAIHDAYMNSLKSLPPKAPLVFERAPKGLDETCMRIRALISAPRRNILRFNIDDKGSSFVNSHFHTAADYGNCSDQVNPEFSLTTDIRPEVLIVKEMHRRAFNYNRSAIDKINTMAEGIDFESRYLATENKRAKFPVHRITEKTKKTVPEENMRLVIKRPSIVSKQGTSSTKIVGRKMKNKKHNF